MVEFFVFFMGLAIGSFLNVLIDRLPRGKTIWGRSQCDYCKKTLAWYELVPILSWILQGACCRRCHKPLSVQYPLVELGTGVGFVLLYFLFNYSFILLFAYFIIFSSLLVIFVADLKYQIIPDSMVIVGILGVLLGGVGGNIASAVGASLFFLLLWLMTQGRAMGLGDVKLGFLLGLFLGYPRIIIALYAAFLTGAGVGVILILVRKARFKSKIAFGPFLILGTLVSLLVEKQIITWWKGAL